MQLSVIILNYNVRHFLELCVLSVQKALQHIDAEIIVVDNNSKDDSCRMMKDRFPEIQLIENKENFGFPKGNNIGVAQAKGDFICILNPDTVVAEDTFLKLLEFVKTQQNPGIIGCKLIDGTGNFLPESKRGVPTPWVAFTKITGLYRLFPKGKLFGSYYAGHLSENENGEVEILVGAFMLMKRELYLEIGGFDEACFMYADDIDLSYRVLQSGRSNYYFSETSVIHYKGESTSRDGTYMRRFQEAMSFFYKKHFWSPWLFTFFMKIGIVFFSILKRFQGRSIKEVAPKSYCVVSSDENWITKFKALSEKNISEIEPSEFISSKQIIEKGTEVILDAHSLSFKEIIEILEKYKNKGLTFKIRPQGCDFLLGSNQSFSKGEVVEV